MQTAGFTFTLLTAMPVSVVALVYYIFMDDMDLVNNAKDADTTRGT
jgi:hypothetical protein